MLVSKTTGLLTYNLKLFRASIRTKVDFSWVELETHCCDKHETRFSPTCFIKSPLSFLSTTFKEHNLIYLFPLQ